MLKNQVNSRKQGDVGLGAAIRWFTKQGYTTCIPLTDSQKYDLIIDIDGVLNKVQVKTSYYKRKYYEVVLKTSGGNKSGNIVYKFNKFNIDLLFILTNDDTKYLIPSNNIGSKTTMILGPKYDQYIVT